MKTRPTLLTDKSTLFWTNTDSISVMPATVMLMFCEIQDALSKYHKERRGFHAYLVDAYIDFAGSE
jgi:hypothetical protein